MKQEGWYCHVSNGNKAYYEILKPHFSGSEEYEVTDQPDADELVPNPMPVSLPEDLITDDLEFLDEIGLQRFLEEGTFQYKLVKSARNTMN